MMRKVISGMVGAAALVAVAGTALVHAQAQGTPAPQERQAGPRGPGGPGGPWGHGRFGRRGPGGPMGDLGLLRGLDLTEDQRAQVRQIMQGHRDEFRAVGERLQAAHRAQQDAVEATPFDENAVRARAADVAAIQADAVVLRAKVRSDVFAVLTPEQQAKAAELKAQRAQRMEQFRQQRQQRRQQRAPQPPPAQ
jgi:Spy/CpxP family protein refolding chaperone